MDLVDLQPQLDLLEESIDHLEEVIRPLLKTALSDTATNLPLLDKAKLYVLVVYSIESLLFCKILLVFRGRIITLIICSCAEAQRCGREESSSLQGVDKGQAIL